MIGLPLLVCPSESKLRNGENNWRDEEILASSPQLDFNPWENYSGHGLNLNIDIERVYWGLGNTQDIFDTVLLARQDRKSPSLYHLELLVMLHYDLMKEMKGIRDLEKHLPMTETIIERREAFMQGSVCKDGFEKF
ncbi:hypothetical protein OCU04_011940 [Sclerotinia nivalis]|uniref:Uncharacterized protein n=1 Tax=Sclerotinia nivalis TaxID=352851 RepID=A0A9X0AA15_9HELO|nr:hypothetical protein OCU04_011940 [Sclerotinia nivalis]